jgi:HEAT repeat protein
MRKTATLVLLSAVLLALPGCALLTETNPEPKWSTSRWRSELEKNRERLAGEDRGSSSVSDIVWALPRGAWNGVEWSWNAVTGRQPIRYAKQLFDANPDRRREAVYEISDHRWGRAQPYTAYYAEMGRSDAEPTVRTAAIRALNRSRAHAFTQLYIAALGDADANVRVEAAKALANIPSDAAASPLARALANVNEHRDVRLWAADALRQYRTSENAQVLIRVLNDRDFGVARQARHSLRLLTGRDFQYDQAKWLEFITGPASPFG